VPVAAVLSVGAAVCASPVLAIVSAVRQDRPVRLSVVAVLTVLALATLAVAPLASVVVSMVERWRLGIADPRPLPEQRPHGLAGRFSRTAAWRETAYMFLLGAVVPIVYAVLALVVALDLVLIASPALVGDSDQIILAWITVDTPGQAAPLAVVGVLVLPILWYLIGLVAAVQATVARRLLGGPAEAAVLREITRSRARLVGAYEADRSRIERDVHDGAQPRLTSLTLQLGLARLDVPDDSPAAKPLDVAHDQAKSLMVTLREIVRGIRPQSLAALGLAGAVRELAGAATVPVTVTAWVDRPLPDLVETTAYFVVSESLNNVVQHAGATRAEVRLTAGERNLVVEVEDDGHGGADPARGTGLTGLADRIAAVDGRLLLASPAGGPTLVRVELPCR
jgi:signal transduction histidine kinase